MCGQEDAAVNGGQGESRERAGEQRVQYARVDVLDLPDRSEILAQRSGDAPRAQQGAVLPAQPGGARPPCEQGPHERLVHGAAEHGLDYLEGRRIGHAQPGDPPLDERLPAGGRVDLGSAAVDDDDAVAVRKPGGAFVQDGIAGACGDRMATVFHHQEHRASVHRLRPCGPVSVLPKPRMGRQVLQGRSVAQGVFQCPLVRSAC